MADQMPKRAEINGLPYRVRVPKGSGPHPLLVMVHGFKGTEDVTWVFTRAAGPEWLIASPRAPYPEAEGYSWHRFDAEGHTDPETFATGLSALKGFISGLTERYPVDKAHIVLLGFSQGGAMVYACALSDPGGVAGIVSLGGYLPRTLPKPLPMLNGLPVLILHGTEDDVISVEVARKNRVQLVNAGAQVTYLEEKTGHKIGADGMRTLARWLAERLA